MPEEPSRALLERLQLGRVFSSLDVHFAAAMCALGSDERPRVLLAAALASRQTRLGHVCADLHALAGQRIELAETDEDTSREWPELEEWLSDLRSSAIVSDGSRPTPLVLVGRRLYLFRYWEHERVLAETLERMTGTATAAPSATAVGLVNRLLPPRPLDGIDWQRFAAELALLQRVCIVSGGPGTGKTSTVVKLCAAVVAQALDGGSRAPRVLLLAPTGKAAARLVDAVKRAKSRLECTDEVLAAIPEAASTIHRALKPVRGSSTQFEHDGRRPLPAELVVVDECSMVDVALMRRLIEATPRDARLILLGDANQLASVEAGAVFADICNAGRSPVYGVQFAARYEGAFSAPFPAPSAADSPPIADAVVRLTRSYRFDATSGIGRLADAMRDGDAARALDILAAGTAEIERVDGITGDAQARFATSIVNGYRAYLSAPSAEAALLALEQFRLLAAHRRGPHGVEGLNVLAQRVLAEHGLIDTRGQWYVGRPILIVENDYQLELFNGDVGVILPDEVQVSVPRAYFVGADGQRRVFAPARLPEHETVFAMSIHKSQGSEFDEVAIVLPQEKSPIVTRELLYTALTRAKKRAVLYGSRDILCAGIEARVIRASGLHEKLWGAVHPAVTPSR
jgi:exodeoxyribonuclease V alpha subunit